MTDYQITPVSKPRMTQRDKWKKRPATTKYFAFKDEVKRLGITVNESGDHITFIIPMPKSWSRKKMIEMDGMPHQQRPDVDNLTKALLDSIYEEDAGVWDIRTTKVWGALGKITIENGSMD